MPVRFTYDVFLSHSSKDKEIVRPLAERLRRDGINVWYDEWEIKPGDSIPAKIERGLDHSRVLLLCMSENAFSSDWAQLESGTFRFRDPLNKTLQFLPLKIDESIPPGSLGQFLHIDWRSSQREASYSKLLEAVRTVTITPSFAETSTKSKSLERLVSLGHTAEIRSLAFSPNGIHAITGSNDKTIRLWEVSSGRSIQVLEGHTESVNSLAFSPCGIHAISGSDDKSLRLWDVATGQLVREFTGHTDCVNSVAFSFDGLYALSGADDHTMRLWEIATGRELHVFTGHSANVNSVTFSPDGIHILSGSDDQSIRLWDVGKERTVRVFDGHKTAVNCVVFSPDGVHVLSGSDDGALRLWKSEHQKSNP